MDDDLNDLQERQERIKAGNDNLLDWARQTIFYTIYQRRMDTEIATPSNSDEYVDFLNSTQDLTTEQFQKILDTIVREHGEKALKELWNAGLVGKTLYFVRHYASQTRSS